MPAFVIGGGLVFVASLVYAAWSYAVPFGARTDAPALAPAALNVLSFTVFAGHHSLFARTRLRQWIAGRVSPRLERSVYVWIASLLLLAVMWLWRPVGGELWRAGWPWSALLAGAQIAGVLVTLRASMALDVFALAGIRQALSRTASTPSHLVDTGLYGWVRHPVYFGWVLMVWPVATMTGTRFVFAAVSTLYLVLAIPFEERSLRRQFGDEVYAGYAARVPWKMLPWLY